jgi:CelD/BcsL family acetyltransferase involved in cellulose biosynthesis
MVGRVSPDLRTAFFTLQRSGPATVEMLAQQIGWAAERAEAALHSLVRLRLALNGEAGFVVPLAPEPLS